MDCLQQVGKKLCRFLLFEQSAQRELGQLAGTAASPQQSSIVKIVLKARSAFHRIKQKRHKQMRQPIWSFATNDVLDLSPTYQNDSRAFSPSDSLEQFRC
jgi:hypothetical protein